ncbi:MAG: hypothetical protein EBR26_02260, partial [Microbacteriaceae bacterium]|nr:hypothetical protein [Microbacteriaceae bacterium]
MRPLSNFVIRHSKLALFGFVGLVLLSLIGGLQAFGNLKGGGYNDPNAQSSKVTEILKTDFKQDDPEVILIVDFNRSTEDVQSQESANLITSALLETDGVNKVSSYFTLGRPETLRSADGKAIYMFVKLDDDAMVLELNGLVATGTIDKQDSPIEYGSEVFDSHFIMNVP